MSLDMIFIEGLEVLRIGKIIVNNKYNKAALFKEPFLLIYIIRNNIRRFIKTIYTNIK